MESRAAARRQRQRWASRNIRRLTSQASATANRLSLYPDVRERRNRLPSGPKIIRERRHFPCEAALDTHLFLPDNPPIALRRVMMAADLKIKVNELSWNVAAAAD